MSFLVLPITGFFSHISAVSISTIDFSNLEYSSLFCSARTRTGVKEDPLPSESDELTASFP